MKVNKKVNFEELARSTDEFNGAQLKVCLHSARIVLRATLTDCDWSDPTGCVCRSWNDRSS